MPGLLATGYINEPFYVCVLKWSNQITTERRPELAPFLKRHKNTKAVLFLIKGFRNTLWGSECFLSSPVVVGEGKCPVGVVSKVLQLLKKQSAYFLSCNPPASPRSTVQRLQSFGVGAVIFDHWKELVLWMPSRRSDLVMVSSTAWMGTSAKYWLHVNL